MTAGSRARARTVSAALALVLGLVAVPGIASAQRTAQPFDPQRPLFFRVPTDPPPAAARNVTPLDPVQMAIAREAQQARDAGQLDLARLKLDALPASIQHHPIVLTERARIELAAGRYGEVVRLATIERRAQRDSLLLGRELVEADEALKHMREASAVVVEVWAMAPAEENWAMATLLRLAPLDLHAGRDALRRAFARDPRRSDMARGLAALEWTAGDLRASLKLLRSIETGERGPRNRWAFGEALLQFATARDSAGAADVFADIAADIALDATYRMTAAKRGWEVAGARGIETAVAPRLYQALKDIPRERWMPDLSLGLARALRMGGDTGGARALLGPRGPNESSRPELNLERSLADLRDGPPERVLDALKPGPSATEEQRFHYAEALFFAGQPDSAAAWYKHVAEDASGPFTGAALERLFMIEDGKPRSALPAVGRIAYEQWRSAPKRALALAESLWTTLPRGPLWAQTALIVVQERERAGDARGALAAALALADSLPADRLAPVARQRAGDIYSQRLKDDAHAIEQYEACVARYPRAWNAPEVRRRLEDLRRSRRF